MVDSLHLGGGRTVTVAMHIKRRCSVRKEWCVLVGGLIPSIRVKYLKRAAAKLTKMN